MLQTIKAKFGWGGSRIDKDLKAILIELQGLKVNVAAGTTANTNIPISGITTEDTLKSVLQVEPDNGTSATMLTDRTAEASITSNGNIRLSTTNTTGKQLLVIWYDKR
ncbi:MAG: hypothetical protein PHV74_00185 [Dehalococcoidia bacterium]|nr:hypothetical protein [Dehalococcoidia bacterium]